MALEPAPLTWLESLTRESIHSWDDLKKAFIDNFQGSLHRVATRHALAMCKQEPGEAIRSYVKRFFDTRATIANVSDEDVITTFMMASPPNHFTVISGGTSRKWWWNYAT